MIDPKKTYRTHDGREVRIYAVDGGSKASHVHGAVKEPDGWHMRCWNFEGIGAHVTDDLIEVKPKHVRWVNLYPHGGGIVHGSKEQAENIAENAVALRLACIRVEFEEGEGL